MSQRWERVEEALPEELDRTAERVAQLYHIPVLFALLAFMLWNRTRNWERFLVGGEVMFNGNDAWYHLREVRYVVQNWPTTMPFDPWTGFPVGHASGQFGTLYDQIVATVALVVGLGSPSDQTVALTLLFAPAVFGTLAAIPVYLMAERLGGRRGGLVAVLVLALTPGSFLRRSLVGFSDHHVAEVLFLATGVALAMMAVSVGERERPIYELVVGREWDALRRPALWSGVAGLGTTLYLWAWPPGVLLLVILGTFFALKLSIDYLRGTSPDHVAFVAIVSMAVTALLTLLTIDLLAFKTTSLSLLQPGFALIVGLGAAFMAWLARLWDGRGLPRWAYPVTVATIGLAVVGAFALTVPELFDFFVGQALRVVGYDATAQSRTVGEAQPIPLDQAISILYRSYGLALFVAAGGVAYGAWQIYTRDQQGEVLLLVILAAYMTAATLTQQRFNYYLAIPVAVLNGYFLGRALELVDLDALEDIRSIESYQILAVLTVVVLVMGPFVAFPAAGQSGGGPGGTLGGTTLSSVQVSDGNFPGEVTQWEGSLEWLANETPAEGRYARPDGEAMAYYGRYARTADFPYQEGSYGVMSWWDYGHFITVQGERIPYANPFQQHATEAAVYLLEPNETNGIRMLSTESDEQTRFVMLDWKLAYAQSGKFSAPLVFYDTRGFPTDAGPRLRQPDVYRFALDQRTGNVAFILNRQRHYDSMRTRLYKFHGSAIDPSTPGGITFVVDYQPTRNPFVIYTPAARNASTVRRFNSLSAARQFVERDGSAQIGGFGGFSSEPVPALERYRLVHASESSALRARRFRRVLIRDMRGLGLCRQANQCFSLGRQLQPTPPRWVKTFERVPGARVEGDGPPNATVTASATFRMPGSNQTFTYRQHAETDEAGRFTMRLPYSTTGYDRWGPAEGHTNVSVRATGPYRFSTPTTIDANLTTSHWRTTADVPEGMVIGEVDGPVRVTLEKQILDRPEGAQTSGGSDNETNGTSSGDSGGGSGNTSSSEPSGSDSNTTAAMAGPQARAARD